MEIFSLFLPIKSSILMLKAQKLLQRCRLRTESPKNLGRWNFLKILVKIGQTRQKMQFFLQKCDLFKITFWVITWARMTLETWNFVNVCGDPLQDLTKLVFLNILDPSLAFGGEIYKKGENIWLHFDVNTFFAHNNFFSHSPLHKATFELVGKKELGVLFLQISFFSKNFNLKFFFQEIFCFEKI